MTAVSVILPTHNRARPVVRALASVLYQSFTDFELIVVDDGSTDGTPEALAPFRDRITCLSHPRNLGVSAARNTGLRAATAPLICLLDSDDYWLPEKLAVQEDFFRTHPRAVACQTEEIWIRKGVRVNPQRKHLKPSGDIFVPSLRRCLVSPSAVMLKRSLLDEVGGFDEDLPVCEDYDLWLRIACRHPVHLIRRYLVVKEGGSPDQLSARCRGMDRYRIKAMTALLRQGVLTCEQQRATLEEVAYKCALYGKGCLKRGKTEEAAFYLGLPERLSEALLGTGQGVPTR